MAELVAELLRIVSSHPVLFPFVVLVAIILLVLFLPQIYKKLRLDVEGRQIRIRRMRAEEGLDVKSAIAATRTSDSITHEPLSKSLYPYFRTLRFNRAILIWFAVIGISLASFFILAYMRSKELLQNRAVTIRERGNSASRTGITTPPKGPPPPPNDPNLPCPDECLPPTRMGNGVIRIGSSEWMKVSHVTLSYNDLDKLRREANTTLGKVESLWRIPTLNELLDLECLRCGDEFKDVMQGVVWSSEANSLTAFAFNPSSSEIQSLYKRKGGASVWLVRTLSQVE